MANRYQQDLKKIVGLDEDNQGLAPAEERDPLPSRRGLAYFDGLTGAVSALTGAGGSVGTSPPPSTSPLNEATGQSGGWQTGGSSGGYPSGTTQPKNVNDYETGIQYEDANFFDVENIFDGTDGPTLYDGSSELEDYNNSNALRGLTGVVDCVDNQDIEIFFDGGDNSAKFPPPNEDWVDAETPPTALDSTWQSGFYWVSVVAGSTQQASPAYSAQESMSLINAGVNQYEKTSLSQVSASKYSLCYRQIFDSVIGDLDPPGPEICVDIDRFACGGGDPTGPGDYCTTTQPDDPDSTSQTEWPSDSTLFLRWNGTTFETSQYEGDIPTNWNQSGSSTLNFCTTNGRTGTMEPAAGGGIILYETSGGAPIAGGFYKRYSPTGALIEVGDNANIANARPR